MKKIVAFVLVLIFSISLLTTSFGLTIWDYIGRGLQIGGIKVTQYNVTTCPQCGAIAVIKYGTWSYVGPNNESSGQEQRTMHSICQHGHVKFLGFDYR